MTLAFRRTVLLDGERPPDDYVVVHEGPDHRPHPPPFMAAAHRRIERLGLALAERDALLEEVTQIADKLITRNRPAIEYLARHLHEAGRLSGEEIIGMFQRRSAPVANQADKAA